MRAILVLICALSVSCIKQPELILSEEQMIDILVDKYLAEQAMSRVVGQDRDSLYAAYHEQILRIHDVSDEDYEMTMTVLLDDLRRFEDLHQQVKERMRDLKKNLN